VRVIDEHVLSCCLTTCEAIKLVSLMSCVMLMFHFEKYGVHGKWSVCDVTYVRKSKSLQDSQGLGLLARVGQSAV